jgi:forkhead protein FKH
VARQTDEPGKGMKWCITPEHREEMVRNAVKGGRGGHRGSSVPGSPANLDNLRASKDTGAPSSGPRRNKRSPRSGSPAFPSTVPQFTPDRKGQLSRSLEDLPGDGSPLPPHKRSRGNFGLSDNMPGSPPALSSSYLQDESNSFVTPAPHRVHPRLAPPSTAQRPSQVMPTSSPAPFWKYADIGNTPMKGPAFESSPIKGSNNLPAVPPSSSPPPVRRSSAASPTRNGAPAKQEVPRIEEIEEEDQGFDLTRQVQTGCRRL